MIFLLIAILSNLAMTFAIRYSESHSANRYGITVFNYLTGAVISYLSMQERSLLIESRDGTFTLLLALGNAVLFVSALLFIQSSTKRNGAPLTSTFNRMGILIPTIASAFLFGEIPSQLQMAGIGLAIFAIIYINGGGRRENGAGRSRFTMFGAFAAGGCVDLTYKIFDEFCPGGSRERFVFYTFAFSLVIAVAICLRMNRKLAWRDVLLGVMVGVPNQMATLFLLKAVGQLPAYLVYPGYSAGVILAVNAVNLLVFRERLSRREYIATAIIALGLVFINV